MKYAFVALGVWTLYQAWRGVVPNSLNLWGKSEAHQRMRVGQRMIFGLGGALITAVGLAIVFSNHSK